LSRGKFKGVIKNFATEGKCWGGAADNDGAPPLVIRVVAEYPYPVFFKPR
jgi:hypothetical protein